MFDRVAPLRARPRRRTTAPTPPDVADQPLATAPEPAAMFETALIDGAAYIGGQRLSGPTNIDELLAQRSRNPEAFVWLGLYRPTEAALRRLAKEFGLHELALEDAIQAHQRPKIERYGETLFVVLRAARYLDAVEEVEFGELHLFIGPDFIITVRHAEAPDLSHVRSRLESNPELLRLGAETVLYAVMDQVVDEYAPVVAGLDNDIDEIEAQVFTGDPQVSRRIYELSREVVDFQRATKPLMGVLGALDAGSAKYRVDDELKRYLRDVADHLTAVNEQIVSFRAALRDILTVNATLVAQRQNEEMTALSEASNRQNEEVKKVSGWAAIGFAPTLIGTLYGMNFDHMPELHWRFGYAFAIGLMVAASVGLYVVFKRRHWI